MVLSVYKEHAFLRDLCVLSECNERARDKSCLEREEPEQLGAENRLHTQKAILTLTMGGRDRGEARTEQRTTGDHRGLYPSA